MFWTPYNDFDNEGSFIDVYSQKGVKSLDWETAQPNGHSVENNVVLMTGSNKLRDVIGSRIYACLSCMIPFKSIKLRGLCKSSYLGKFLGNSNPYWGYNMSHLESLFYATKDPVSGKLAYYGYLDSWIR